MAALSMDTPSASKVVDGISVLGGGGGGRASVWFTVVAGGRKDAWAMHPSFSYIH